jgi:PKD repeat protein
MIHYASVCDQNGVIYACWQVGGYGGGRRVEFNFGQGTEWAGVGEVPNSAGGTLTDIAVSPDGGQIYIVWDGNGEIIFSTPEGGGGPPPNELPVASFTFSPETGEYPLEVTFDASSSYDPDGSVVGYEWNFGDGGTGQGKIVKHTYREKATFTIRLTVKDDRGATGSISQRIKVIKPNVLPVAAFTFSPARGLYPLTVTFDASSSHDPDGAIAHYYWDFGDGETGRGKITTHTYQNKGTYSIELTVDDYRAGTDTKVKSLTVLSLKQPLNIHWQTFKDESLFQIRYVTQVDWERNPENDPIAEVVTYRIYRKAPQEPVSAYRVISEVNAQTFTYRDYDISGENQYVYTVTALDGLGHESPIEH